MAALLPRMSERPIPRWLSWIFWFNLAVEVLIVVTGGLVRLTGSGLGCPDWPQCVPGSLTPTRYQEQSWHKYVEFGNRTLTGLVSIAAVALIVGIVVGAPRRRGLRLPAVMVLVGIAIQAIVGGISVHMKLNPAIVAVHLLTSMLLVWASAWLVWRSREDDAPARPLARREIRVVAWLVATLAAVVLLLGTLVTGSGPHSGDADEPARLDVDPRTISWLHADSVTLFTGLVIATLLALKVTDAHRNAVRAWTMLLLVTLAQGLIGYVQYFTGLPWLVVLLHMLGACLLVVATTWAVLSLRSRTLDTRGPDAPGRGAQHGASAAVPAPR